MSKFNLFKSNKQTNKTNTEKVSISYLFYIKKQTNKNKYRKIINCILVLSHILTLCCLAGFLWNFSRSIFSSSVLNPTRH